MSEQSNEEVVKTTFNLHWPGDVDGHKFLMDVVERTKERLSEENSDGRHVGDIRS